MNHNDVHFNIERIGDRITGFSLKGVGETYAEAYCFSFMFAKSFGKANVSVDGTTITFEHRGITRSDYTNKLLESLGDNPYLSSDADTLIFEMETDEAATLDAMLNLRGDYAGHEIKVVPNLGFGKGFTFSVIH